MTRRGVVGGALALSALASGAAAWPRPVRGHRASRASAAPLQPFGIVVDRTLPAARTFAEATAHGAATLLSICADPGPAWMSVIEPRLRQRPAAIAGLTTGATLFCLEYLGRDYGLVTAWRLDGGTQPTRRWIEWAAGHTTQPDIAPATRLYTTDTTRPRAASEPLLDLADPSGNRAGSIFAWLLVPKNK